MYIYIPHILKKGEERYESLLNMGDIIFEKRGWRGHQRLLNMGQQILQMIYSMPHINHQKKENKQETMVCVSTTSQLCNIFQIAVYTSSINIYIKQQMLTPSNIH